MRMSTCPMEEGVDRPDEASRSISVGGADDRAGGGRRLCVSASRWAWEE